MVVAMGSYCLIDGISIWEDKKVSEVDGGDSHVTVWLWLMPPKETIRNGVGLSLVEVDNGTLHSDT